MASSAKVKFRSTKEWREFRLNMISKRGTDYVTGSKLSKRCNLHHLDMREENYADLDEERFMPLNQSTHDAVHFLYRYYVKDRTIIDRLRHVMEMMYECSHDAR